MTQRVHGIVTALALLAFTVALGAQQYYPGGGSSTATIPAFKVNDVVNGDIIGGNGAAPLLSTTNAQDNVVFGYRAGENMVNGVSNDIIAIGRTAWGLGTSTTDTIAIGALAGFGGCGGSVFIGIEAGTNCGFAGGKPFTGVSSNVGLGKFALYSNARGSQNTALGRSALQDFSAATEINTNNTAVGYNAGDNLTTGVDNTILGANCDIGDVSTNVALCSGNGAIRARHNATQWIMGAGGIQYTTATEPTCNASNRGLTWYVAGGASVADTYRICSKDASDAYAWRTLQ